MGFNSAFKELSISTAKIIWYCLVKKRKLREYIFKTI